MIHGTINIKLTAYSCICWLFHRIYYDARNHIHKIEQNSFSYAPTAQQASSEPGHPQCRGFTITLRHTTLGRTPLESIPTQRPLPDNTHHSQETNIHAPGGIRTRILSKRAAADACLRPGGNWDPQKHIMTL